MRHYDCEFKNPEIMDSQIFTKQLAGFRYLSITLYLYSEFLKETDHIFVV
jgi:hypothetical protein